MKGVSEMRLCKKVWIHLVIVVVVFLTSIIIIGNFSTKVEAASVKINKSATTLEVGEKCQLEVEGIKSSKIKWKSSNMNVAFVNSDGLVSAKKAGKTTITATVNKQKYSCKITVVNVNASATDITVEAVGGGELLLGESVAKINFILEKTSSKVKVTILDVQKRTMKEFVIAHVKAGETTSVEWPIFSTISVGDYIVAITAGKTVTMSEKFTIRNREFASGNGSKEDPYLITSLEDFDRIRNHNNCYFKQTEDLNFNYNKIAPLFSDENNEFQGFYDGDGHTITNFQSTLVTDASYLSIFGRIGLEGTVQNLNIENTTFSGGYTYIGIIASINNGTIKNCTLSNCTVKGYSFLGLIAGMNTGEITSCNVNVEVFGADYAGGIVGKNLGTISNCNSSVVVNISQIFGSIGGIVAVNEGTVVSCTTSGSTTGGYYNGAICGYNTGYIEKCTNNGNTNTNLVAINYGTVK